MVSSTTIRLGSRTLYLTLTENGSGCRTVLACPSVHRGTVLLARGGAEVARLGHNQEVGGSNPPPATSLAVSPHCAGSLLERTLDGSPSRPVPPQRRGFFFATPHRGVLTGCAGGHTIGCERSFRQLHTPVDAVGGGGRMLMCCMSRIPNSPAVFLVCWRHGNEHPVASPRVHGGGMPSLSAHGAGDHGSGTADWSQV